MDDLHKICRNCHEIVRAPAAHTCGRNPAGALPANAPHRGVEQPGPRDEPTDLLGRIARALFGSRKPTQADDTLAGPSKGASE